MSCSFTLITTNLIELLFDWLITFQAFELATGDYLFEPHSGEDYTRDEGTTHSNTTKSNTLCMHSTAIHIIHHTSEYFIVYLYFVFRSHRSHHWAARADPSALCSVWQVLQRVLQQKRWDSLTAGCVMGTTSPLQFLCPFYERYWYFPTQLFMFSF